MSTRRITIYDYPRCPDCRSRNRQGMPQKIRARRNGTEDSYHCTNCGADFRV